MHGTTSFCSVFLFLFFVFMTIYEHNMGACAIYLEII